MLDQKLCSASLEVGVAGEGRSTLDEGVVGGGGIGMGGGTRIVEGSEDAWGTALFDEIAYNLVVKVLDGSPFNLFADVFLLLGLERKFNKDLLQLLVNVVDAKLFKGVVLAARSQHMNRVTYPT